MRLGTFKCAHSHASCSTAAFAFFSSSQSPLSPRRRSSQRRSCCNRLARRRKRQGLLWAMQCDRLRRIDGEASTATTSRYRTPSTSRQISAGTEVAGRESPRRHSSGACARPRRCSHNVSSAAVCCSLPNLRPEAHSSMPWPLFLPTHRYPLTATAASISISPVTSLSFTSIAAATAISVSATAAEFSGAVLVLLTVD